MEHYMESDSDDESESGSLSFALHDAAATGDMGILDRLLAILTTPLDQLEPALAVIRTGASALTVNDRDEDRCTPLHLALINGQLAAVEALLKAEAAPGLAVEGAPALHTAACVGALPSLEAFATEATRLLLLHKADPTQRDDQGRLALHWAAENGLLQIAQLLQIGYEAASAAATAAALAEAGEQEQQAAEAAAKAATLPPAVDLQDRQGLTPLHCAAKGVRHSHTAVLSLLLSGATAVDGDTAMPDAATPASSAAASGSDLPAGSTTTGPEQAAEAARSAVRIANKVGQLPLHCAAAAGNWASAKLLHGVAPKTAKVLDRRNQLPSDYAERAGWQRLAHELSVAGFSEAEPPEGLLGKQQRGATLLLAPAECRSHLTAPEPMQRGGPQPPPENVNRLRVLTEPGTGILHSTEFGSLKWDEASSHAALADVLRIHEWAYVRKLQARSAALPDRPDAVGYLDGDTAISHGTFAAALAAAGAVCRAVDAVMAPPDAGVRPVRNVFCAIRPPGHHAGPTGVVTCDNDPHGSHGFCLLNNIAIAAAYAVNVYRHQGVRRVAILDFDVHHGNGTEACVGSLSPAISQHEFVTPFGSGAQSFPVWRPWLDADDAEHTLFASVQGYGPRHPAMEGFVYPGSGATCDTRPGQVAPAEDAAAAAPAEIVAASPAVDPNAASEDPDGEFGGPGSDVASTAGPRIINVGIPGPGGQVALWRRAWRDKILPAVVNFKPDMIFISAGFDAHKKDDINYRYIGVAEKEYEWLTDQIVQVANRCCEGRVVSALEGGYRIQGGPVSAFARSVAAHVRALSSGHLKSYRPADAQLERTKENERAAAIAAAQAAAAAAATAAATASQPAPADAGGPAVLPNSATDPAGLSGGAAAVQAAAADAGEPANKRRRRGGAVDYVALNAKLEAEASGLPSAAAAVAAAVASAAAPDVKQTVVVERTTIVSQPPPAADPGSASGS